jgi:hypothetical protein
VVLHLKQPVEEECLLEVRVQLRYMLRFLMQAQNELANANSFRVALFEVEEANDVTGQGDVEPE